VEHPGGDAVAPRLPPDGAALERAFPNEDLTVVIPIRDRFDFRVAHTLGGIRAQTYPQDRIHIVVVDYGSQPDNAARIRRLAEEARADYRYLPQTGLWNRSHALNIGIKACRTKYLQTLDSDVVLPGNYLEEAVRELQADPLQVVSAPLLDLPEAENDYLEQTPPGRLDSARLMAAAKARTSGLTHDSMHVTLTYVLQQIRGYDETYYLWGTDDNDIARRFAYYGLKVRSLVGRAGLLHQWHPRLEGYPADLVQEYCRKNWAYFVRSHSLVRNPHGWGEAEPLPTVK
jgi:GT2 family glycosyltransferase